jgi:WD40 repeat protein
MSACNDKNARFWDVRDGHQLGPDLRHRGEVFVAEFSPVPESRLAVTSGYDATVRLWNVPTGEPVGEPMRHEYVVRAAVFSLDGQTLLTGSADRSARLWDVATCLPLGPQILHNSEVSSVAFDPTGRMALTGRLWRLPAPLPDDQQLIDLWVQLATQRTFTAGDNIEWLDPAALEELAVEFRARTGKSWSEWANSAHERPANAPR